MNQRSIKKTLEEQLIELEIKKNEIESLEKEMLKGFSEEELQEFYQYIERMKENISS